MPPTIKEDRDSSRIASDEHKMETRPRVGNSEFRPGLTASDFDHAVAERASRDTTCVALAMASTSLATIQELEVQPGTIPEPGLLQVGLFSNHSSRRPFGSRIRCRVHNCILLERGSEKKSTRLPTRHTWQCKSQATPLVIAGAADCHKGGASPSLVAI